MADWNGFLGGATAGVPLEAQPWPEGYVGKPFVSSFVTYLRAPYDGTYRCVYCVTCLQVSIVKLRKDTCMPLGVQCNCVDSILLHDMHEPG
jgi:hypothetical protein